MVHELLQYAREVEIWHGIPQHEIIDELDRVLSVTATDRKMLGPLPTSYEVQENPRLYVELNLD